MSANSKPPAREARWIKEAIRAGAKHHFRHKRAWRHNALNLGATVGLLAVIAATVLAGRRAPVWPYLPLAALLLGWAYFALLTLVIHEASHGMFVLARAPVSRRRWNRFFGWCIAFPFAIHYVRHWEHGHRVHHLRPIEPDDPQALNRLTGFELLRDVVLLVLVPGYAFFHRFFTAKSRSRSHSSPLLMVGFLLFWIAVAAAVASRVSGVAALALLLALPILSAFNQVKGALEHGGEIAFEQSAFLRSRTSLFFGRRALLPFNVTLHFEHHLNFCVPWYDLPRFHRELRSIVPAELQPALFNRDVFGQLSGRLGRLPDSLRHLVEAGP